MVQTGHVIAAGTVAAILGTLGYNHYRGKRRAARREATCDPSPYTFNDAQVAATIDSLVAQGMRDVVTVAAAAAEEHFGQYPPGGTVSFPPGTQPPRGVGCVWARTLDLAEAILAGAPLTPADIIDPMVSDVPMPNTWYPVTTADGQAGITGVARRLFGFPVGDGRTTAVIRCIIRSGWNITYFGRVREDGNPSYHVRLGDKWFDIGPAFQPRNTNAVMRMMRGERPNRTIRPSGAKITDAATQDNSYGAIWIPDVQLVGGQVMCPSDDPWHPSMLPPGPVLEMLGTSPQDLYQHSGGAAFHSVAP